MPTEPEMGSLPVHRRALLLERGMPRQRENHTQSGLKMGRNSKGVRVALLFCAVFSRSFVRGKLGSLPCAWLACCCSPIARRVSLVCFTLFLPLGLLTAKRQIRVAHTSQPPDHHHSPPSTSSLAFNHRLQSSPSIIAFNHHL